MQIYDISLSISDDMPVFPGDPKVNIKQILKIESGDPYNISLICIGSHNGTHVDPPYHFVDKGLKIDQLPLEVLVGRAVVFEMDVFEKIDKRDLEKLDLKSYERVLFKTRNSQLWNCKEFCKDFVYLTKSAAEYLIENGIKLVGVDYLSIEKYGSNDARTHHTLLENGVFVIEGLNLSDIDSGEYELICLPLKIKDGDGAPARVILRST